MTYKLKQLLLCALTPSLVAISLIGGYACEDKSQEEREVGDMSAGNMSAGNMSAGSTSAGSMSAGTMNAGAQVTEVSPWVNIGTGFRRYEELSEGQEVPIIAGIQGGFHVWGGFVGAGFNDLDVRIIYTLELSGETLAKADYTEFELPQNSTGDFEYAGVSVIYFRNEDVDPTSGREMTLKLEVITQDGLILRDEKRLIPLCCE